MEMNFYEEEEIVFERPFYLVIYVDDFNMTHMAMVKDEQYLKYLKERYFIKEIKHIED